MKNIFSIVIAGVAALSLVSCADDLKEQNIDPANVTETLPPGLMTAAINVFQPNDYLIWFYNVKYFTTWSQMGCTGGFGEDYTAMAETGGQGTQYINVMKYRNRINQYIEQTGETKYNGYAAATDIMTIYLAIFDSDVYGDIPYTEACSYETDGIITPAYDKMEDLYKIWVEDLNKDISLLTNTEGLDQSTNEDAAYGCDWAKWAKLANSLKLKIAARLYNNDKVSAITIVQSAVNNSAGLITSIDDDFRFCKATAAGNSDWNDYVYGTGNGLTTIYGTKNVMDFMLQSKDPRIRFIYTKNGFNSKVVQSFIDNGKFDNLPSQVKANVVRYTAQEAIAGNRNPLNENPIKEGDFKEWGGMGEPWVRYTSLPVVYDPKSNHGDGKAITDEEYEEYFNSGTRYQLQSGDETKSYSAYCSYTNELRRGRIDYQVPTAINDDASKFQDTKDCPLYSMYLGAAEVDLYLAEFAVLTGGSLGGKTAVQWYNAGVEASVREFDALASDNKIPYYGTTYGYDDNEKVIDLQEGEISAMLETANVDPTNTSNGSLLEKIYIQQLINFSEQPDDQFVTARRSGYPMVGSKLLPFVHFPQVNLTAIPRRFEISQPVVTDLMYQVKCDAYKAQGFDHLGSNNSGMSYNSGSSPLNTERVWFDKNAPQWGTPSSK